MRVRLVGAVANLHESSSISEAERREIEIVKTVLGLIRKES